MVKLLFRLKRYSEMLQKFQQMLSFVASVTRNECTDRCDASKYSSTLKTKKVSNFVASVNDCTDSCGQFNAMCAPRILCSVM